MQGTKLTRAKLWIAGVSTIAILLGCETEPVKEQAANGNRPAGEESRATAQRQPDAIAVETVPMADMSVAHNQAKTKADAIQGAVQAEPAYGAAPASPTAEHDQLAQQGALAGNAGAFKQRGDYFATPPLPGEGESATG